MKLKINIPLVFVTLCCFIISVSLQSVIAQTGDTTKVDPNIQLEKLRKISLELVNQHQFTFILPNKKALKYEIKKEDKFFALPSDDTQVVLFKLSDYEQPYTLVITSPCQCLGFNKKNSYRKPSFLTLLLI